MDIENERAEQQYLFLFYYMYFIFDLLYKNGLCNCMNELNYYFKCCVMRTHTCLYNSQQWLLITTND